MLASVAVPRLGRDTRLASSILADARRAPQTAPPVLARLPSPRRPAAPPRSWCSSALQRRWAGWARHGAFRRAGPDLPRARRGPLPSAAACHGRGVSRDCALPSLAAGAHPRLLVRRRAASLARIGAPSVSLPHRILNLTRIFASRCPIGRAANRDDAGRSLSRLSGPSLGPGPATPTPCSPGAPAPSAPLLCQAAPSLPRRPRRHRRVSAYEARRPRRPRLPRLLRPAHPPSHCPWRAPRPLGLPAGLWAARPRSHTSPKSASFGAAGRRRGFAAGAGAAGGRPGHGLARLPRAAPHRRPGRRGRMRGGGRRRCGRL